MPLLAPIAGASTLKNKEKRTMAKKDDKALTTRDDMGLVESPDEYLKELGFSDDDLADGVEPSLAPVISIDIDRKRGNHRFCLDAETYFDDGSTDDMGDTFTGLPVLAVDTRALWEEGADMPLCASAGGVVQDISTAPKASSCAVCSLADQFPSECKPKKKLLMLVKSGDDWEPRIFLLPPTSLKHWRKHIQKLGVYKYFMVVTEFSLSDNEKGPYRWATVNFKAVKVADRDLLEKVKVTRDEFNKSFQEVKANDFREAGDRAAEQHVPRDSAEAVNAEFDADGNKLPF